MIRQTTAQGTSAKRYRFLVLSSNRSPWGGSEELWAAVAVSLAEAGHAVTVCKQNIDRTNPSVRRLAALGCRIRDIGRFPLLPRRVHMAVSSISTAAITLHSLAQAVYSIAVARPDLVIVSQGGNFDGLRLASVCRSLRKPFVLISQKAGEIYWPADELRDRMRELYPMALRTYFISEHNRRLTEEEIGVRLTNASVVRNPFLVDWKPRDDWPSDAGGLRLACVGRLYPSEKGQDLLIRVLARDKWRARALSVTFYGRGDRRTGLEEMARYLGVTSVTFAGFTRDVRAVWNDHHGLVLPSRCEGLPLVLVEAMLSGRVPIVTDVAGSGEIVRDGVTGFLAAAPTEDLLDEAMERAWQRRHEWRSIGAAAATSIRTLVPADPAGVLAEMLLRVVRGEEPEAIEELGEATGEFSATP